MRLRHLQGVSCVALTLLGALPQGLVAQQAGGQTPSVSLQGAIPNGTVGVPGLPPAPDPKLTEPLYLRPGSVDYSNAHPFLPNPLKLYVPTNYPAPLMGTTLRLDDLVKNGVIYLSLGQAVTLALENNFDIEIARINLDIADTDILRAKAGSTLRGVSTGLVENTLGGSTTTITGGGGPGGTTAASGGSGTGASGLVLSTSGGGPTPETIDPTLTGTLEYQQAHTPESSTFLTGTNSLSQNTATYNFGYTEGFLTGTALQASFNNSHTTTNSSKTNFNPLLNSSFNVQLTQHLLQGFGTWVNGRFILQAKNTRRITDSAFKQQLIYTVGQVESIYWALVSAYEDEQAKERALQQSTQLTKDNRKQLEIGTLAPLDVVNSDSAVASDQQALITSKTNLEYQQLLMKQAISQNLNDPTLAAAAVVPTDRVGLDRLPEEDMTPAALVQQAYANNPQVEQAALTIKNDLITIRAEKNGELPVLDAFAFYGGSGLGGTALAGSGTSSANYANVLGNTFNNTSGNYGVGVNLSIPLRNRTAQADQVRSQMEYRQAQIRLQQLYTQLQIQVINAQYALTNDRGAVNAAQSARDFAAQSLDAEQKKLKLGASTTANVLQQERNLATAEDNLISATAAYARDRSSLGQILANTLDRYGISITDAAKGRMATPVNVPGLTAPKPPAPVKPLMQ